jgi:hypothetical protein
MKKSLLILLSFALLCIAALLFSCTKNEISGPDPVQGLTKQAEGFAAGAAARVEVYTKEAAISTGYTRFFLALFDSVSGQRIDDALIQLTPVMDMGMMQHSAPYENPGSGEAVNHLFPCSITFIMPSTSGAWTVKFRVHNQINNKEGFLVIPITVNEPVLSKQKSFTAAHDGNKYFISLTEPGLPKVGINDMEIVIYKKASMMSWPADSSLSLLLDPEMPTMGHGSPNNVNPVHIGKGHYKGKVNFTMTGLWRLNLDFMAGNTIADTTQYFDIEF